MREEIRALDPEVAAKQAQLAQDAGALRQRGEQAWALAEEQRAQVQQEWRGLEASWKAMGGSEPAAAAKDAAHSDWLQRRDAGACKGRLGSRGVFFTGSWPVLA